jgi:glutamate carboxypeptidase
MRRVSTYRPVQFRGATSILGSAVYGRLQGTGTKKILLIAHMDTVYPKGMLAKQPYRIEGNRAYGLAIADDKAGVALIIHTVELLQKLGFKNYAEIGVLINADEEIGSPGSGSLLTQLGGEYDAVFSYEGGGGQKDWVRLATSSIAIATLNITGKASHAGAAPEAGRNALYEMAHQVLKSKDLGDKSKGLTINWTVAKSGETRNVIPAEASAIADIRASANADLDQMEAALQASIKERLIPDTKVELAFLRSRPAFVANDVSRTLAKHAVTVFKEINLPLEIRDTPTGGGTDAAFAGLKPKGGVLESFGLRGFGAHSNDNEYIYMDSIEPRLYLSTRMVIDVGNGAVRW